MVRTVRVRLELDRDDYKRGLRDAANETRGFDGEVRSAGKDAHAMGVEVKATGTEVQSMGREVDAAAGKTTKLGDETDKTKTKTTDLGKEITKTKAALAEMGAEFQKTGQVNVDELSKLSNGLRDLEKAKAALGKLVPGGNDSSKNSGGGLLDFALDEWIGKLAQGTKAGLKSGMDSLSGMAPTGLVQWLIAGAVVAAPAIGAAINAGILLGLGGAGLAAGIIGAIQDPGVKAAWGDFGDFLKGGLAGAAGSFVGPMQSAAISARAAFSQVFTGMRSGIDALAPSFIRLVDGLAGMLTRIDLGSAFASAAPIIDALAQELPLLGSAMNSLFQSMASGGPGAVAFFHDLMLFLDGSIMLTGKLVEGLSKVYDFFRSDPIGSALTSPLLQFISDSEKAGDKGKKAGADIKAGAEDGASGLGGMAYAASQAALSVDALNTAVDKMVTAQIVGKNAHLAFNQSILDMKDAVAKNGQTLDDHTEKGIANSQALLKMAQAAEADRQSVLQQTGDVGKATVVFDEHMNQVYATAAALGLNRDQVDLLIGSIKNVPHDTEANIALKNAGKTKDDIREINRGLTDLNGKTADTYVTTHYTTTGTPVAGVGQAHAGFADGGTPPIGRPFWVGERGPELMTLGQPGHVFNATQSRQLAGSPAMPAAAFANARPMAGAGGGNTTYITIPVTAGLGTDGYQVGQQIVDALRPFVQRNGGGSVQMAIVGRQVP